MADTKKLYKGFKEPLDPDTGKEMDDKQRSAWQSSIDSRILDADFKIPEPSLMDDVTEFGSSVGRGAKTVYKGADALATDILQAPVKYAKDPLGEGAKIEQAAVGLAKGVASGDPESIRTAVDVAGVLPVVGEAADATAMALDLKEGDYAGAAISGAALLLPFVSSGMLKAIRSSGTDAAKKASKQLDDLEKGLESGSISKEQAQIQADKIKEDFLDYKLSEGSPKSAFEPFPEYVPSPTGITSDSTKKTIKDAVSKVKETSERIGKKTPGSASNYKIGTWDNQYRRTGYSKEHEDRYQLLKKGEDDAMDQLERSGLESGSQAEEDFFNSIFDENLSDELMELESVRMRESINRRKKP